MWLIEWLKETWNWIVTGIGFANLVAIATMLFKTIKMNKEAKRNNALFAALSDTLSNKLSAIESTKDTIDSNTKSNMDFLERINTLESALIANNRRIGAMLDIMGIVYMRSKDEDIRKAVATVINTLQYRDNQETANLKLQVEDLKVKLDDALTLLANTVDKNEEVSKDVNEQINVDEDQSTDSVILRG